MVKIVFYHVSKGDAHTDQLVSFNIILSCWPIGFKTLNEVSFSFLFVEVILLLLMFTGKIWVGVMFMPETFHIFIKVHPLFIKKDRLKCIMLTGILGVRPNISWSIASCLMYYVSMSEKVADVKQVVFIV